MNKFNLNERVLLQSKGQPELNGEYTVIEVKYSPLCICETSKELLKNVYIYKLDDVEGLTEYWAESALRKRHVPGEYSFDELMNNLKLPEKVS